MADEEGLYNSGDYSLKEFSVYTSDGNVVDLTHSILELNIFEDLWAGTMSGNAMLSDALDIGAKFAIHGNEYLNITVDKPGLDSPIIKTFRIYKISDKKFDISNNLNFVLYFCSEETILSATIKIRKSYKGMLISDMVKDIATNYLMVSPSRLFIEPTEGVFDIIIPNMDPLQAISWLATRAYAQDKSIFMFFENRDGFNFSSFETLIKKPTYNKYIRSIKNDADDLVHNSKAFNLIHCVEDFNILNGIRYGAYSSSVGKLDIVNRQFTRRNYNAYDFRDNNGMLNKGMLVNDSVNRANKTLYQTFDNTFKFIVDNDSDPTTNPTNYQFWMGPTISKLGQLTNMKWVINIPGDVIVRVGMVIEIEVPSMNSQDASYDINKFRSGRYLVSAVSHKFTGTISITNIELVSDSMAEYLPTPISDSPTINGIKRA